MYHMKTIVPMEDNIILPQCMYHLKNPNNNLKIDEVELNISDQVMRFLKVYFNIISTSLNTSNKI